MSELEFLSLDRADAGERFGPLPRSPLERSLGTRGAELGIEDVSLTTGKIEVRGDTSDLEADGFEVVNVTPRRALVLCAIEGTAGLREKLREQFLAIDLTGALAGLRIERPGAVTLMRRLTELDLDSLPAVGAVAHIQAHVLRDGEESFRLFFAQEYGHYVAEVVVDAAEGVRQIPITPPPDPEDRS